MWFLLSSHWPVLATFSIHTTPCVSRHPPVVVMQATDDRECHDTTVSLGHSRQRLFLPEALVWPRLVVEAGVLRDEAQKMENTTGRPCAAARNAIWLTRMVFPPPGLPVTISVWRLGIPPPSRRSRFGMPVSKILFAPRAMAFASTGLAGTRAALYSRRATESSGVDVKGYHLRRRRAWQAKHAGRTSPAN